MGEALAQLGRAGVRVSAIGSPIGKIPLEAPLGPELDRMRRIADIAGEVGTAIVRVFSFFIPPGEPPGQHRDQDRADQRVPVRMQQQHGLLATGERRLTGHTAHSALSSR